MAQLGRKKKKQQKKKKKKQTSTKTNDKISISKRPAPKKNGDNDLLPFDYEILSLSRTESSKPASLLWMSLGLIVAQIILLGILYPKSFFEYFNNILTFIKVNLLQEILFYVTIIATLLISLDIYNIDKLKKFESRIERGIFQLHRSFFSACKQGITVSNRAPNDIIDWQINSLIIVLIIYLFRFETDIQFSSLKINQVLAVFYAIICGKFITIGARLSWFFEYVLEIPIFAIILFCNSQIARYLEIPMDSRIFEPSFVYIINGYMLHCGTRYFELRNSKIVFWGLIIFVSLPYLIVKFVSNMIPFVVYYPMYAFTKLAVIIKPKSLLRHFGLTLLIVILIISRYLSM